MSRLFKKFSAISLILTVLAPLGGCIKDELPGIEVDILDVSADTDGLLNVIYNQSDIDVYLAPEVDPASLCLAFVLSEGATIAPDPASVSDYSSPRKFSVTSEDRNWTKEYTVRVRYSSLPTEYDFENWEQPERMRYQIPYELDETGDSRLRIWASGNEAYNFLTNKHDDYTVFPTQPTDEAYSGKKAAKLVTRLTGQIDKPMAAGNLFIGRFDASMREPKESTMFGLPFSGKPLRIKGYYKYRSGGLTLKSGVEDKCRIQAVLYRTDKDVKHLNGFNIRTSPNIAGRAELLDGSDTPGEGYVAFDLEFRYDKEVDRDALARGGYNLAVIFSASAGGDSYDGADGSTLLVDGVRIICE